MSRGKLFILLFVIFDFIVLLYLILIGKNIELFNPAGVIAYGERHVIFALTIVMLILAIPVLILLFFTAYKYREGNTKVKYDPDGKSNPFGHFLWWAIPSFLVVMLAIISYRATHKLDPYKPIESSNKTLTIQVVALDWKWLFIYPEQNIATVNYLQLPVDTPINFILTADAPMNSFWIPQLSGQIYAMSGMSTQIHMMANKIGEYSGSAAEINGKGFADMRFVTRVTSQKDFDSWVVTLQNTASPLDEKTYNKLAKPSENTPQYFYSPVDHDLYDNIVNKFVVPTGMDMKELHEGHMHHH